MAKKKHNLIDRVAVKWGLYKKRLFQLLRPSSDAKTLFILGCQRSGTTLMTEIFMLDSNTEVFSEKSVLNVPVEKVDDDRPDADFRLREYSEVQKILHRYPASLRIAKPIVESQYADRLLEKFESSKVVWIYRKYPDVVASNLKKFGIHNGINDLKPIINRNENDWRYERVTEEDRALIESFFSDDMNPYDAAALFWYVRNKQYFHLNLDNDERVLLIKYEDLVEKPSSVMRTIYQHIDVPYPGDQLIMDVRTSSVGKGASVAKQISAPVSSVCDSLLERLNNAYSGPWE